MVGTPPPGVEWQVNDDPSPLTDHRVRPVKERVGGSLFGTENGGAMVNERTVMAPRGVGSVPSGQVLCQGQAGNHYPTEDRQHDISRLHQQSGGDSVPQYEQDSQRTMEGHSPPSGASSGCAKHNSGRGIQSDERQVRLDARPESLQTIQARTGPLSIDLFASRLTTQLQNFFSWRPDPEAIACDAFFQNWSTIQGHLYANPPWPLIGKALSKAIQCR